MVCLVALLVAATLVFVSPASAQSGPKCFGKRATIVGTPGDDVLLGTPGDDVIVALGGRDAVHGLGGDDLICGGRGNDRLVGGTGNDVLFGGSGRDVLAGGQGSDGLNGGYGRDVLRGGRGADVLNGADGVDRCVGDRGPDQAGFSCETTESTTVAQVVDVGGAEVKSTFTPGQLPQVAKRVLFSSTILDNGSGPKLCTGIILDSYPPQCGTYDLIDYEMVGDWFETASGVRWGGRRVTVSWPPVEDALELINDGPGLRLWPDILAEPRNVEPVECVDLEPETATEREVLQQWAAQNPDLDGGLRWFRVGEGNVGFGVQQVNGDAATLASVRAELSTATRVPCLVPVDFNVGELEQMQAKVTELFDANLGITSSGRGTGGVFVDVAVADRATVEAIIAVVDRPDLLHITGTGAILRPAG